MKADEQDVQDLDASNLTLHREMLQETTRMTLNTVPVCAGCGTVKDKDASSLTLKANRGLPSVR